MGKIKGFIVASMIFGVHGKLRLPNLFPNILAPNLDSVQPLAVAGLAVYKLRLMDAGTDRPIPSFEIGANSKDPVLVDLAKLATTQLNIEALTNGTAQSIRWAWNGQSRVENTARFAFCGNKGDNFAVCPSLKAGFNATITVTPYTEKNGKGIAGEALSAQLVVYRTVARDVGLTLMHGDSDKVIGPLQNSTVIVLKQTPSLNVKATVDPFLSPQVTSVLYVLDGRLVAVETTAPYTMNGQGKKSVWKPSVGRHNLTVTAYSRKNGAGTRLASTFVKFVVVPVSTPAPVAKQTSTEQPLSQPTAAPVSRPVTERPVVTVATEKPVTNGPAAAKSATMVPVAGGRVTETPVATRAPSKAPATNAPSKAPVTNAPSKAPVTNAPIKVPVTNAPSKVPVTNAPSKAPMTNAPSKAPVTKAPVPIPISFIHDIEGTGNQVAIEGIVTSVIRDADRKAVGFFLQEEDSHADSNSATSEGIYVLCCNNFDKDDRVHKDDANQMGLKESILDTCGCATEMMAGDKIKAVGIADTMGDSRILDMSERSSSFSISSSNNPLPSTVIISLPAEMDLYDSTNFKKYEGMLVTLANSSAVVADVSLIAAFGAVAVDRQRNFQFTQLSAPDSDGAEEHFERLLGQMLWLDDDSDDVYTATSRKVDRPYAFGLSRTNRIRVGDQAKDVTGVLQHFPLLSAWRLRPVQGLNYTFQSAEAPPVNPASVPGDLRIVSYNLENYFITVNVGEHRCHQTNPFSTCPDTHSTQELDRQTAKIVAALEKMDADIVGLVGLENSSGDDAALERLVLELNTGSVPGSRKYNYLSTGGIGEHAVRSGFIFKPASVALYNPYFVVNGRGNSEVASFNDQANRPTLVQSYSEVSPFNDRANRPTLIQSFMKIDSGRLLTIALNDFASRDEEDCGEEWTGQGSCSGAREEAADAVAQIMKENPTSVFSPNTMIMGALNSYAMENVIVNSLQDFVNPISHMEYNSVAYCQFGTLDYALVGPKLADHVTGSTVWHINADECPLFDYDDDIQDATEYSFERKSSASPLYSPDAFRSSGRDPIIVGLDLQPNAEQYADLRITEVRFDAVSRDNEWFELYNNGKWETNLESWSLVVNGNTFVLPNVSIPAGGYLIFGSSETIRVVQVDIEPTSVEIRPIIKKSLTVNEIVMVDVQYSSNITLYTTSAVSSIALLGPGNDLVTHIYGYTTPSWLFANVSANGASLALMSVDSDQVVGWCASKSSTPGKANDCVLIVITEVMQDQANQRGWIEIYNRGKTSVDLSGWTMEYIGGDKYFVIEGEFKIDPGEYKVFGASPETSLHLSVVLQETVESQENALSVIESKENGGLSFDYQYSNAFPVSPKYGNFLRLHDGFGPNFPLFYLGPELVQPVSLAIRHVNVRSDETTNFCLSTTSYGSESGKGTPGAVNDCV
jgi:predicted extracellular nuclease